MVSFPGKRDAHGQRLAGDASKDTQVHSATQGPGQCGAVYWKYSLQVRTDEKEKRRQAKKREEKRREGEQR